jgi:hypothetical protein
MTRSKMTLSGLCLKAASDVRAARISRRLRLEPKHFLAWMVYSRGFARCEAFMNPLSASDVFLTVAIMSVTFLTEVALFILIGMI